MENKPVNLHEITDIWPGAFEALSVSQFDLCFRQLDFPFPPTKEIRLISRDFALSYLEYLDRSIPEQPSTQLFTNSDDSPLLSIWNSTFSRLQEMGHDEVIYKWGKKTYRNYDQNNVQIAWSSHWDSLLTDWANNPVHPSFETLHLPDQIKAKLQSTIKRHFENSQQLRQNFERIQKTTKTAWEMYAFNDLHVGTWMQLQAQFVATVAKWDEILKLLDDTETISLQEWGWLQFEKIGIHSQIPLAGFRYNSF